MTSNQSQASSAQPPWISPSAEVVRAQIYSLLRACEMSEVQSSKNADVMVDTDLSGVDSHGISMLMDYNTSRRDGRLNLNAELRGVRNPG